MKLLLLLFALYQAGSAAAPEVENIANPCSGSGYSQALCMSYVFYEAQRSGALPGDQRVTWRGDSALDDGNDVGHDLTGGYYDAGDHVKFGFPMAFTATTLAWGLIEFEAGYSEAGQLDYGRAGLKWATDYFIKCHTAEREFYGQVGHGNTDHAYWGKPEDMTMYRPAYKIDTGAPGSDLAGETAAALAAASIVFQSSDSSYSSTLLTHAIQLFDFADQNRGVYSDSIADAANYYGSWSGYGDELCWSALWLYRATNDASYLTKAQGFWDEYGIAYGTDYSWDQKSAGAMALFSLIDGGSTYTNALSSFLTNIRSQPTTPGGMVFVSEWGSARHAANVAFIALVANKAGVDASANYAFAKQQIDYILGESTGRPFVVGYGNGPERPHHRSSSCPDLPEACDADWAINQSGANPQTLYGALVGGPGQDGSYVDDRNDYVKNEVACDYNAGFTGALAALVEAE
uniref:Endoglucanase n=1 Tax=Gecarcoidea natalis TaxID=45628 RepID=A0A1L2YWE3_9EUCA|nr:endo-beta-1,4-glucanase isozyme GN1 [Gecarcoidea natalis]